MIYLDYSASSPPFPEVAEEFCRVSLEAFGNPGALHQAGAAARSILQDSRKALARLLQVRPEEVFFTSGGTEANNWAVKLGASRPDRRHIVCSAAEHSSVLEAVKAMERTGCHVTWLLPDRQGRISPESAAAAMGADTALLCVQAVNNETGVLQDVDALAHAAHSFGAAYLCDSVQSFGHAAQDLHKADFLSLSAHKLGGPRGVGCLIIRQPYRLSPLLHGGGQEFGLRSGTENLPGIAGFALAARLSAEALPEEAPRLEQLMQLLRSGLRDLFPRVEFAGGDAVRSPGILSCRFPGISAEEMVILLDEHGICASPGAACGAGSGKPSHVLLSMGYSPREAAEFVRFSPGRNTTQEEILETLRVISEIFAARS